MATTPLKKGSVRITVRPTKSQKSNHLGRPKGTIAKREFEDTKVGCYMKIAAPLEYGIIMNSLPSGPFQLPEASIVRSVAKSSGNKVLRNKLFLRFLELYETKGAYQIRKSKPTPGRVKKYTKIKECAEKYIAKYSKRKVAKFKQERDRL